MKNKKTIVVIGAGLEGKIALISALTDKYSVVSLDEFKEIDQTPFKPIREPFKITAIEPFIVNNHWDGLTSRARRRKLERELKKKKKLN